MSKVYFKEIDSYLKTQEISKSAQCLLERLIEEENLKLKDKIPLKVHFGASGNTTYIGPDNYNGIIDFLEERGAKSCFIETNVIYGGHRMLKNKHIELAQRHGFTRLPVEIADGEIGDDYNEVEINLKHFSTCKIGKKFSEYDQLFVISHFKGHGLSGFGGAIKQLGMGCAARGGKLAQHLNAKPFIIPFLCKKCRVCISRCPANAIETGYIYRINKNKCLGCAACIAACPNKNVVINPLKLNLSRKFREKVAEYAFAAQKDKNNIYISFAFNITRSCDCSGSKMKPVADDIGIFCSIDPVAIDKACMDVVDKKMKKKFFRGRDIFKYAQEIGLGTQEYKLIEIEK